MRNIIVSLEEEKDELYIIVRKKVGELFWGWAIMTTGFAYLEGSYGSNIAGIKIDLGECVEQIFRGGDNSMRQAMISMMVYKNLYEVVLKKAELGGKKNTGAFVMVMFADYLTSKIDGAKRNVVVSAHGYMKRFGLSNAGDEWATDSWRRMAE